MRSLRPLLLWRAHRMATDDSQGRLLPVNPPSADESLCARWLRRAGGVVAWGLVTIALVYAGKAVIPAQKICPDVICFWSAAELMAGGQSPYDVVEETRVQRTHGWNKATDGIGLYDCLPYFYPPWFAM